MQNPPGQILLQNGGTRSPKVAWDININMIFFKSFLETVKALLSHPFY